MILPKALLNKMEYFEHTIEYTFSRTSADDVFVIHFKGWWRFKKVIKISRDLVDYDEPAGTFTHRPIQGSIDLHDQLNAWVIGTFVENVKDKYETNNTDNVIKFKPNHDN